MQTRVLDLAQWKMDGHKWAMLTAYDYSTARAFAAADIPVLLVGDSAANVVYGYDTTTQVSLDEMIFLTRGVVRGAPKALVVADMPFGTYEASDEQAILSATRMMRESGAQMVKLEGGVRMASRIRALVNAGIPVMAHIGFTPQSVHALGGFKVQGRGDAAGGGGQRGGVGDGAGGGGEGGNGDAGYSDGGDWGWPGYGCAGIGVV